MRRRKPLRLDATEAEDGEYLIGFGPVSGDVSLSETGDPVEAAARLFDLLHQADAAPSQRIAIAPVPGDGIAAAIRDRLKRAAAPRPDLRNQALALRSSPAPGSSCGASRAWAG